MTIDPAMVTEVLQPLEPKVVYVFGSVAAGRDRPDSDVDLGVLPGRRCDPYEVFQLGQQLAARLRREVDLVDLSQASAVLRARVVTTGRRLATQDERRAAEFEMYALSDYARANEERRPVLAAFGESPDAR